MKSQIKTDHMHSIKLSSMDAFKGHITQWQNISFFVFLELASKYCKIYFKLETTSFVRNLNIISNDYTMHSLVLIYIGVLINNNKSVLCCTNTIIRHRS